jgi:hypothetical protein
MSINYSTTMICNMALAELPFARISSINDATAQANECLLQYSSCWAELLEMSDWGFARTRLALTLLEDNDREGEWLYAYSLPSDMATVVRLLPPSTGSPSVIVELMIGQTLAWPAYAHDSPGVPYDYAGATLYSNVADAVLEYVAAEPGFNSVSALFVRALALLLAMNIAVPLTKDRAVKQALMQEFEMAKDRAIATNANRRPQRYGENYVSEVAQARTGGGGSYLVPNRTW